MRCMCPPSPGGSGPRGSSGWASTDLVCCVCSSGLPFLLGCSRISHRWARLSIPSMALAYSQQLDPQRGLGNRVAQRGHRGSLARDRVSWTRKILAVCRVLIRLHARPALRCEIHNLRKSRAVRVSSTTPRTRVWEGTLGLRLARLPGGRSSLGPSRRRWGVEAMASTPRAAWTLDPAQALDAMDDAGVLVPPAIAPWALKDAFVAYSRGQSFVP